MNKTFYTAVSYLPKQKENFMFNVLTAKPREIESYLREVVRKSHGDVAENGATINASRGYYSVSFMLDSGHVEFSNFRRKDVKKIAKAIRAMK